MSTKYKFRDQSQLYFVSFSVIFWIDLFVRREYKDIVVNSIKYCQENKGLLLYGYCIMSSHVHLIIGTEDKPMQDIIRDLKKYTSYRLLQEIKEHPQESRKEWLLWMMNYAGKKNPNNKIFQLWQQSNHPIELHSAELFSQKLDYIHRNPVEAGIVTEAEHYFHSSARNYADMEAVLKIEFAY